jgi:hypothetical protein
MNSRAQVDYILVTLAKVMVFARFAVFAMRIAVTILPAGAAGEAVATFGALLAVGLAVEDLIIDFLEIAIILTSGMNLIFCTATSIATRVPNISPANLFSLCC